MSKPLTIDELKALQVGDWVWIKTFYDWEYPYNKGRYAQIDIIDEDGLCLIADCQDWDYREYGETWIAYKNKEQADTKGEWVELPCKLGDTVYYIYNNPLEIAEGTVGNFDISDEQQVVFAVYTNTVHKFVCVHGFYDFGKCVFTDKSEAEARLKELRGEK